MTVTFEEAQSRLGELSTLADGGEEVTILRAGQPVLKLISIAEPSAKRILGQNRLGITYVAPDFDKPWCAEDFSPEEAEAERAVSLPLVPKDPFDRILIAQALVEDLTLLTADRLLSRYAVRTL